MAGAARAGCGLEAGDDRVHDLRPRDEPTCDGGRMLGPRRHVPLHDVTRSSSSDELAAGWLVIALNA